jgi:hypothetical protein
MCSVRTDWVWLTALKVPDSMAPTWPDGDVPKQIHLDLAMAELETAVAEAERPDTPGNPRGRGSVTPRPQTAIRD